MPTVPFADGTKYLLGKGALYVRELDANGLPTGNAEFLGNADKYSVGPTSEIKKKGSSVSPTVTIVAQAETSREMSGSCVLTEYKPDALKRFMKATVSAGAYAGHTARTGVSFGTPTAASVAKGDWMCNEFDDRNLGSVANVKMDAVAMVLHTDYEIDTIRGWIWVNPATALTLGEITADYTPAADTYAVLNLGMASGNQYVHFIGNPSTGPVIEAELWNVVLNGDGEADFISEDFGSFGLKMGINADSNNYPDCPWGRMITVS